MMSMRLLLFCLSLIALIAGARAESDPVITKDIALKAITRFREADPLSDDARSYAGIVLRFSEKSPDVEIRIDPKSVPFMKSKALRDRERSILLGAFVVGNTDSQLLRGKKKNDSYAGDQQLIATYLKLQTKRPSLRVPEIEALIELEKRGQLRAHVSTP